MITAFLLIAAGVLALPAAAALVAGLALLVDAVANELRALVVFWMAVSLVAVAQALEHARSNE